MSFRVGELSTNVLGNALQAYSEAVILIKEQKGAQAFSLLHDPDGSFTEALVSEDLSTGTKDWLFQIRESLCSRMY